LNQVAVAAAALLATGACTIVVPPGKDAEPMPVPTPEPPAPKNLAQAHVLFVMNLHQSSANLASGYARIAEGFIQGLAVFEIDVVRWAVMPTYVGDDGPRLLLGGGAPLPTSPGGPGGRLVDGGVITDAGVGMRMRIPTDEAGGTDGPVLPAPRTQVPDLVLALQALASSGKYDGPGVVGEADGVVRLGRQLAGARLPVAQGGLDGEDFFDRPRSLFVIVYLQPLARRCALADSACQVDGRSPADLFVEAANDGTASWLRYATGGLPVARVVHVAIGTREGESLDAFRARCGEVPGFPRNLFDVMEPSTSSYFGPLVQALNRAHPGTGQSADLCDLLGSEARLSLGSLVARVAVMAGPPSD
jgi:hypothetical protein